MIDRQYETVIIGGGQAGLATSYYLTRHGLPHVILDENDGVGAAWKNRWDSLRLFTPRRYSCLPGMPYPGELHSSPGKDEMANYLEAYAKRFDLPVKTGVKVVRLRAGSNAYIIETEDQQIVAHNVVVATGAFRHPRIPVFADQLDRRIFQVHSSQYRNELQAQSGPVLVVGAGQSGAEIAIDLARDHKVWLSGRDPGEQPVTPDTFAYRIFSPLFIFIARNVMRVSNPIGRKVRNYFLHQPHGIPRAGGTKKRLQSAGVEWVTRTTGVRDGYPELEDGRVLEVTNVIWCTGFKANYTWIDLPIFDKYGYPVHKRGVVHSHPGLYFMGLLFQRALSSPLLFGVSRDAKFIANHLASERVAKPGWKQLAPKLT